jgi:hypothetical protein
MFFLVKNSHVKRKREPVRCLVATANSFVPKVKGEVFAHFHAVAVKRHSSMRNWLFGLPGRFFFSPCVKENDVHALDFALHLSRLFRPQWVWTFRVRLFSSLNTCLINVKVLFALFPKFSQNLKTFLCRIHREIASGQLHDSK